MWFVFLLLILALIVVLVIYFQAKNPNAYDGEIRIVNDRTSDNMANYSSLAEQWLKIATDCSHLVNTTSNPDVFFERYDLLIEKLLELSSIEHMVRFNGTSPSQNLENVQLLREEQTALFINRSFEKMINDAKSLKTSKGKINRANKYFSHFQKYEHYLSDSHVTLLRALNTRSVDLFNE